jgi:hypothetical protein
MQAPLSSRRHATTCKTECSGSKESGTIQHHDTSSLALEIETLARRLCRPGRVGTPLAFPVVMIRKLKSGKYRLYSRKLDPKTRRRRNLGTFDTRAAAEKHEHAVQFFKRRG